MKIGNFQIKIEPNTSIIAAVIVITIILIFCPEVKNADLFKLGFTALISWGAGYAQGKISNDKKFDSVEG